MNVLISGASSGIGNALSRRLCGRKHAVWGVARNAAKLDELREAFPNFRHSAADVADAAERARAVAEMKKSGFMPDAVVFAAAIFSNDRDPEYSETELEKIFRVNVFGALGFVNLLLPDFLRRGSGQFVALSSIAAFRPNVRGIGYPASKAALAMAFRGLDLVYRKRGIAFSTIHLGPVATPMWEGGSSGIVASAEGAASHVEAVLRSRSNISYYPFLTTFLFRTSLLLPDSWYTALSERFFKKNS